MRELRTGKDKMPVVKRSEVPKVWLHSTTLGFQRLTLADCLGALKAIFNVLSARLGSGRKGADPSKHSTHDFHVIA